MKTISSVFLIFAFLVGGALAQTNPTQITAGKIIYEAGTPANQEFSEFASSGFISRGRIFNPTPSRWSGICEDLVCKPSGSFNDWSGYGLFLEDSYRSVTLTVNGVTYENVYASGEINLSRNTFQIPFRAKKKGSITFTKPFTMTGKIRICTVSEASVSCPSDKLLLNENVFGRGTVRVTMQIKNRSVNGRSQTFIVPGSYEYKFEN